jgi:hypothetical protein
MNRGFGKTQERTRFFEKKRGKKLLLLGAADPSTSCRRRPASMTFCTGSVKDQEDEGE